MVSLSDASVFDRVLPVLEEPLSVPAGAPFVFSLESLDSALDLDSEPLAEDEPVSLPVTEALLAALPDLFL